MARLRAPAAALLSLALACLALACLAQGRQHLRAEPWTQETAATSVDGVSAAGRTLLSKERKDAKSAPDCASSPDSPGCGDGHHDGDGETDHDHEEGEEGEGNHEGEEGEGHHDGEEGKEPHEDGEEEHDHEEHDHEEHDHEEHDHGPGGSFVALLGQEPAAGHAFELVGVTEGGNMTQAHIATLLDALSGEAEVEATDGHDHGHAHGEEKAAKGEVEVTSWLLANDLLTAFGNGRPVLTEETFEAACPTILACQLDPTCALGMGSHSDEDDEGDKEEENLLTLKAIVSGILLVEVLLGYGVPYAAQYLTGHLGWYISLLNTFSGGVILATGLVHLVPEVIEEQFEVELKNDYPLGMVMMTIGFLLVFFVEQVLFAGNGCPQSPSVPMDKTGSSKSVGRSVLSADMELKVMQSGKVCTGKAAGLDSRSSLSTDLPSAKSSNGEHSSLGGFIVEHRNGIILMVALVVHSMLEGIIVGLQDEREDVILFSTTVAAHKVAAAMALSARFLKSGASFLQAFPFLLVFGLMAPISIMIGTVLHTLPAMVHLVLNGISAGTFVYIGAYEVVREEFAEKKTCSIGLSLRMQRLIKFMLMVLGVVIISLIALVPHEHN